MTVDVRVTTLRMSTDVPAMITFLEAIGLRREITSRARPDGSYDWGTAIGRSGKVAVHATDDPATTGTTTLNLEVPDAAAMVAQLTRQSILTRTWDESFGRAVLAQSPVGELYVGEDDPEGYGYDHHDTGSVGPVDVVAVRVLADAAERGFLEVLGLQTVDHAPDDPADDAVLVASAGGRIRLVPSYDLLTQNGPGADDWQIQMSFDTGEELVALAARLVAAGYADARLVTDPRPVVVVTDPDGQRVAIHAQPGG